MEIEKQIIKVIDKIRPYIQRDGGDVEFVRFHEGVVYVRMLGACQGCSSVYDTLEGGIESILLDEVPGVKRVLLAE